jgi:hypothetical protein
MKLASVLHSSLSALDIFQLPPLLLLKNKKTLSSSFSRFLSLLFYAYLLYNISLQLLIRINFENQQIYNQDIFTNDNSV